MKKPLLVIIITAALIIVLIFILIHFWQNFSFFEKPSLIPTLTPSSVTGQVSVSNTPVSPSVPVPTIPTPSPTIVPTPTPSGLTADSPVSYKDNTISYTYYDIVSDSNKDVSEPAPNGSKLGLALDVVSRQFFEKPLDESPVKPVSIILKDNNLYIDFSKSIYSANIGSTAENALLQSIADAYLGNIDGLKAVYYSVEGKDYSSGHIEFSQFKPYKTK